MKIRATICHREYTQTVDAVKKQLPSRNNVSLALDYWTLMNKLPIRSVIGFYMDQIWASREVPLALKEVDSLFISYVES